MSHAFTLSSNSDAANAEKVIIGAWGCDAPSRTFLSSSWRSVNAVMASCTSVANFTSLSLPVWGSTARALHRKPPSFLRQTPGFEGFGAIHDLHLRIHLGSGLCSSSGRGT